VLGFISAFGRVFNVDWLSILRILVGGIDFVTAYSQGETKGR
jgi:hypothetical protein